MSEEERPLAKENCPNCDHDLDEPINDIWKDLNVKDALREGSSADDIAVLRCPKCNRWNYYNQGSHYWCRFCKESYFCRASGDAVPEFNERYINLEDEPFTSLADTITEVTDGYDNRTV